MDKNKLVPVMSVVVAKIHEEWGGGYTAYVDGHQRNRLRGDGDTEEEALADLANVVEDYREMHGELHLEPVEREV